MPFSDGVIPTTLDKTLNPDGTHIFSLFTQYVPHEWSEEPHTDELEAYADRLIDLYDEVAPGFKGSVLHRDIIGPHQMEQEYGLIGGNIFHGELTPDQLFHMRPAPGYADYRTPIAGLYNASSATHGGGGVCGIPGWQAARAALADRRTRRERLRSARGTQVLSDALPRSAAVAAMLEASSVAVVGASSRPGSFGQRMVGEVLRSPGAQKVWLVNPGYTEVAGRPCLPDLRAVDEAPDVVLLGVGDQRLVEQLTAAAEVGARGAVVFGSAHADGVREELRRIARDAGMALCGAGCMGFWNVRRGVRAMGYTERDDLPVGPVSLVTHSGSVFSTLLRTRLRLGFDLAVSSGQELVTTTADYVDHVVAHTDTRVLALVLETVRDGARLRACLRAARAAGIEVVLLPVGGSPLGSSLVAAHSGAVAGESGSWEALADDVAAHLVGDLAELGDTLAVLSSGRRPRPAAGSRRCTTPAPSAAWWPTSPTPSTCRSRRCRRRPARRWRPGSTTASSRRTRSTSGAAAPTPARCSATASPPSPPIRPSA